jgi:hypothetical protein
VSSAVRVVRWGLGEGADALFCCSVPEPEVLDPVAIAFAFNGAGQTRIGPSRTFFRLYAVMGLGVVDTKQVHRLSAGRDGKRSVHNPTCLFGVVDTVRLLK